MKKYHHSHLLAERLQRGLAIIFAVGCFSSQIDATTSIAPSSEAPIVEYAGDTRTIVRVDGQDAYLLLPVQESREDSRINVVVDGLITETFYVRLASTNTDYIVPFNLSPYKGKKVILDVIAPQTRPMTHETKHDSHVSQAEWMKNIAVSTTFSTENVEKFRPEFHHTPLYGWMNDPNGMFYRDGVWHLYYQYNPYGSKWQNMTWGHSTSKDLINWTHEPLAISPDGLGSIFSGSIVVDKENCSGFGENAIVAFYTSAGESQTQSMAVSTDGGMTFDKYEGNPVIITENEVRDPKVIWNDITGEWNMVLANALEKEVLFYSSDDLKNWRHVGSFGKGLGAQGGVWECPDLFRLPVEGLDEEKWMLIVNINPGGPFGGSATQYFIGDWDGKTFIPDEEMCAPKWLDFGKDYYATVTWTDAPDGRRTSMGWMSNWQYAPEVPTMQFRSANSLPREIGLFVGPDGEIYASSAPSPELLNLRDKISVKKTDVNLGQKIVKYPLPSDGVFEIDMTLEAQGAEKIYITLSNDGGENVKMSYIPAKNKFTFSRAKSGDVSFSDDFVSRVFAPTFEKDGKLSLRIFVDRSSIEVFGNEGKFTMTNLVFPNEPYSTLSLSTKNGKAKINDLKIYTLKTL